MATQTPMTVGRISFMSVAALLLSGALARAEVFSWEANSLPADGGWGPLQQYCEPTTWLDNGWYFQQLDDDACPEAEDGAADVFRNELDAYIDYTSFFVEWRVEGGGPSSELIGGAPTSMAVAGHGQAVRYTFFVASDMARLNRSNLLPEVWAPLAPGVPHTHRLEIFGASFYAWYIDGETVDSGIPLGQFPGVEPFIVWRGRSWHAPALNRWSFIRYGDIAIDGSLDYDTSGTVDEFDLYFFQECFLDPGIQSWPGCRFADFDDNGTVDCTDWAAFTDAWTDPDPPSVNLCPPSPILPTVSQWGIVCMILMYLTSFMVVFCRRTAYPVAR